MEVKVYTQHYDDSKILTRTLEYLYREYGDNLVSWNVSEYFSQYGNERYRLWYVIKEKDTPTNID
jgi:hypothetical protein